MKAQAMVDFLAEMTHPAIDIPTWELHVDEASNVKYEGASLILTRGEDMMIEVSIKFNSPIPNN